MQFDHGRQFSRKIKQFRPPDNPMRLFLLATIALLATAYPASPTNKNRDWQTGTVVDLQRTEQNLGTVETKPITLTNGSVIGKQTTRPIIELQETVVIEDGGHIYTASHILGGRNRPLDLTVNAPVRFVIHDLTLIILNDSGKEQKVEIVKKVQRMAAQPK